jgi:hypothetical protein
LDVVANLVAIVIILVVVVGAKTKDAVATVREREQVDAPATSVGMIDEEAIKQKVATLQTEMQRAQAAFAESQRLEETIRKSDERLAMMEQNRGKMIDLLEVARAAWAEKQKEMDQAAVQKAQAMSERTVVESELKELEGTRARLEKSPEPVVAVAHLPTPMAKTVFGEELHFRLKGGLLSVVPVERLIAEIKNDFQRSAVGSREGLLEAAVGPIQGFVAKYEMNKSREMVSQGGQASMATRVELVGMTIEPLEEPHGQPLANIIAGDGSQLDIELAGRNPDRTTITVWVYPDSFAQFRQLKEHLYSRGFATAARPLPMDRPITGGPQGSRSQAQ